MIDVILKTVSARVLLYLTLTLLVACIALTVLAEITSTRLDAARQQLSISEKWIAVQNKAIKEWQAEAVAQAQAVQQAAQQREKIRTITVERVLEVERAVIPQECTEAVKWGAVQALMFNTDWEQP